MTIEEAIDYLSKLWGNDSITVDETIALEKAIRSLEAWEKIRKIYDEKAHNVKVRYIHDLQIWTDARDIIDKHLSEVEHDH